MGPCRGAIRCHALTGLGKWGGHTWAVGPGCREARRWRLGRGHRGGGRRWRWGGGIVGERGVGAGEGGNEERAPRVRK
jgi:hypothetical protein